MGINIKSPKNYGKLAIVCFGVAVLGVGLHSHFQSSWRKGAIPAFLDPSGSGNIKAFKICGLKNKNPLWRDETCPAIEMEEYFVSMIVICFILSIINSVASIFVNFQSGWLKHLDLVFHSISGVLLLIAGIVYIISAVQIDNLVYKDDYIKSLLDALGYNFRKSEKIIAGVMAMVHALLYYIVAGMIFKE